MNVDVFKSVYGEFRNGHNESYRHPLVPSFCYTDGMRECAETGLWWFVDLAASEVRACILGSGLEGALWVVTLAKAAGARGAMLTASANDDAAAFTKEIAYTDMPEGSWNFYIGDIYFSEDRKGLLLHLPTEY